MYKFAKLILIVSVTTITITSCNFNKKNTMENATPENMEQIKWEMEFSRKPKYTFPIMLEEIDLEEDVI